MVDKQQLKGLGDTLALNLGKVLAEQRKRMGWTQAKVAEKAKVKEAKAEAKVAAKQADVPFTCDPRKEQKTFRFNTKRGQFLTLLIAGATPGELAKIDGEDNVESLIKNAGTWYGYGIKREGGKVFAFVK